MTEFIKKYFSEQGNAQTILNPPATEVQILELEKTFNLQLPVDYKDFLQTTNGLDGKVGEMITIFEPVEKIEEATYNYCSKFFPWAIFIGSNGNLEMFVIDKRSSPVQFGLLPYISNDNDFIPLGNSFEQFLKNLLEGKAF